MTGCNLSFLLKSTGCDLSKPACSLFSRPQNQPMGIDWMTKEELTQSIAPAYSAYLADFVPL